MSKFIFRDALEGLPQVPRRYPRISIIVLNRNGADLLERCLASFHRHIVWPDLEIIVVDHGSSDHSLAVLAHWATILPIRVVACRDNHGFSFSNNRAAEMATGELLLLLNNDIVFAQNPLPRMAAALEASGVGAVGLKQFQAHESAPERQTREIHHIGVRWEWNERRCNLRPYNSPELSGDELIGSGAWRAPAATASVLLCRREVYLAIGGLAETYFYGYEDLDFCMKLQASGKSVVVVNDRWALHAEGSTRRGRVPGETSRRWRAANIEAFDRRFGYAVRRAAYRALVSGDGSWWGRATRASVVDGGIWPGRAAKDMALALGRLSHWTVRAQPAWQKLRRADVLVALGIGSAGLRRACPHALVVAVQSDGQDADIVLPATVPPEDVLQGLCRFVAHGRRIALKVADGVDLSALQVLVDGLRKRGHSVRADAFGRWDDPRDIGDDVHLYLGGAAPALLPSAARGGLARINIALDGRQCDGYDVVLPMRACVDLIADTIRQLDEMRLRGAQDPALPSDGGGFDPALTCLSRA